MNDKQIIPEGRPKDMDPEFCAHVESTDQLGLYLAINSLEALIAQVQTDMRNAKIDNKNIKELKKIAEAIAKATMQRAYAIQLASKRFDAPLEHPPGILAHELEQTPYERWFTWWHNFIQRLPAEDWEKLSKLVEEGFDTSALTPPGTWKLDHDAMRNGVIPASALVCPTTPEGLERIEKAAEEGRGLSKEDWQRFKDAKRSDDEIWDFLLVTNEETGETKSGCAIVSNRRPVAIIPISNE